MRRTIALLIGIAVLGWSHAASAGPRDWFGWTGEADTDYLNIDNWRWAGGSSPPSGVASLGRPTSLAMLLSQRHEIGQAVWITTNGYTTTVGRTANLDGLSPSYLAWNGGNGVYQTYNGIEIDSGMTFNIYNGASYTLGTSPTALSGFSANGLGTNPSVSAAWTGNHLRTSVHVFDGGTFRTSGVLGNITALTYYTANAGIFAEGYANVTVSGDYYIGGNNTARGAGGGHLTLKGYDARSQLSIGKNSGGSGTLRMYPALDQSPLAEAPWNTTYSPDITGSNPAQLRIILDASNNGGFFNTVYTDTLEIRNVRDPAAVYSSPVQFSVEVDGYTSQPGHVFPIIVANTLSDGPVDAAWPQRTGTSLGTPNVPWNTDFTVGSTTYRFLQSYNNQKGVFLAVQTPRESTWYGDGVNAAGDGTWSGTSTTWNAGGRVGPLVVGSLASFPAPGGQVTAHANGVTAMAGLRFEIASTYALGGGPITLGAATQAGNVVTVDDFATTTISAPVAGAAGFQKRGNGELVIAGAGTISGVITVAEGTMRIAHAAPLGSASVAVSGGILAVPVTATLGPVSVDSAGRIVMDAPETVTLTVGSLSVDRSGGGALVDLGVGRVQIAAGADAATIRENLLAGLGAGSNWSGTSGITSSAAAASAGARTVGYRVGSDGSALLAFAAPGDVNLDGVVNTLDLVAMTAAGKFGTNAAAVWTDGDFNYDGVVNSLDLVAIGGSGAWGIGNYLPLPATPIPVPEPAGLAFALAGFSTLAARAWRSIRVSRGRSGVPPAANACGGDPVQSPFGLSSSSPSSSSATPAAQSG